MVGERSLPVPACLPRSRRNDRLHIPATNPLGRALYSELYRDPVRPANHARFAFLDPHAQDFWADWEHAANDTVGVLTLLASWAATPEQTDLTPATERP
jgi:hypothetical protein